MDRFQAISRFKDGRYDVPPPAADLSLSIAGPETAKARAQVTYILTVRNKGPQAATNVVLTDHLPYGTQFTSVGTSQGTCTKPGKGASGKVTCNLGTIDSGADSSSGVTLKITARAPQSNINNVATVSSDINDPNPLDNTASFTTQLVKYTASGWPGPQAPAPLVVGSAVTAARGGCGSAQTSAANRVAMRGRARLSISPASPTRSARVRSTGPVAGNTCAACSGAANRSAGSAGPGTEGAIMRKTFTRGRAITATALLGVLAVVGVGYATIPTNGVISGCYTKSGGTLRVIDSSTGKCSAKETALNWNVEGAQGPAGPAGPAGPVGAPGVAGADGMNGVSGYEIVEQVYNRTLPAGDYFRAECPSGKQPLGGGADVDLVDAYGNVYDAQAPRSSIPFDFSGRPGWLVSVHQPVEDPATTARITVKAICANVGAGT